MAILGRYTRVAALESQGWRRQIRGSVGERDETHIMILDVFAGSLVDVIPRWGESFAFYRDVPGVLHAAKALSTPLLLGTASRTHAPDLANTLLRQLHVQPSNKRAIDYFDHMQIFPGDKKQHFSKIHKASGVPYDEMLFFDDEVRNRNVESVGVVMCLVRDGVTRAEVDRGVREWRKRYGKETKEK